MNKISLVLRLADGRVLLLYTSGRVVIVDRAGLVSVAAQSASPEH